MLVSVQDEILDAVSAADQFSLAGDDTAVSAFLITDDVAALGEADPDACSVVVAQAFLDVVLLEQGVGDHSIIRRFAKKSGQYTVIVKIDMINHR